MRDVGYVEGQNVTFETRWTGVTNFYQPELARELAQLKVDVIVTIEIAGGRAAKEATSTIPIVVVSCDPFEQIVATLARPGGNITGLSDVNPDLSGKRLALLKEVLPKLARVAVLLNPAHPPNVDQLRETQAAARTLGVTLQTLEVRRSYDFERAFAAVAKERAGAVIVLPDAFTVVHRDQIAELAARHRLPTMFAQRAHVAAGGLMAYGANQASLYREAASYIDRILKGAKPGDLPVEQPTKFELVINLKTAKALGLTIPPSLLLRADEVIHP